jgi:hypothetical protein
VVVFQQGVYCPFLVPYWLSLPSSRSIFGKAVAAASAYHHILDAVVAAHTLQGAGTHVKQVRRLCRVSSLSSVSRFRFLVAGGSRTCAAISAICSIISGRRNFPLLSLSYSVLSFCFCDKIRQ